MDLTEHLTTLQILVGRIVGHLNLPSKFFHHPILLTQAHMMNPPFAASLKPRRHTNTLCAIKNGIGGWYK